MAPENGKYSCQQQDHEFRGEPHFGIFGEVVGIAMGTKAQEPSGCGLMTLLAGCYPVGIAHLRGRISRLPDVVVLVAVETLRGVRVSESDDLAVIGCPIGFICLLMTIAAILGDEQPRGVLFYFADAMGGVAVGAGGGFGVGEAMHSRTVDRAVVFGLLLRMAAAADLGS